MFSRNKNYEIAVAIKYYIIANQSSSIVETINIKKLRDNDLIEKLNAVPIEPRNPIIKHSVQTTCIC